MLLQRWCVVAAVFLVAGAFASYCGPAVQDDDLSAALDAGTTVFFVRATTEEGGTGGDINDISRCAVESALRNGRPVVFYVSGLTEDVCRLPALGALLRDSDAGRLWILPLDYGALFAPLPTLSAWFSRGAWDVADARSRGAHLSDGVRLALLHTHGGVYLDSDELLLHGGSLAAIGERAMGLESPSVLASAVLAFPRAHPFIAAAIDDFARSFNGDYWGFNGPLLVTRTWAALAPGARGPGDVNVTIHPPSALYGLPYEEADALFCPARALPAAAPATAAALCRAHAVHLWNHVTAPRLAASLRRRHCDADDSGAAPFSFEETLLGSLMADACPATLKTPTVTCDARSDSAQRPPSPPTPSLSLFGRLWGSISSFIGSGSAAPQTPPARPQHAPKPLSDDAFSWRASICASITPTPSASQGGGVRPGTSGPPLLSAAALSLLTLPPRTFADAPPETEGGLTFSFWVFGPAPQMVLRQQEALLSPLQVVGAGRSTINVDVSCADGRNCYLTVDGAAATGAPLVPGRWHFVALVWQPAEHDAPFRLTLDGVHQPAAAPSPQLAFDDHTAVHWRLDWSRASAHGLRVADVTNHPSALPFEELARAHNSARSAFVAPPLLAAAAAAHIAEDDDAEPAIIGLVHPDWTGVRQSHYRVPQFDRQSTFEIRTLTWGAGDGIVEGLLSHIASMRALRLVVINGVLDATADFARRVRAVRPDVQVAVVIHSAPSSPYHSLEADRIAEVVQEAQPRADGGAPVIAKMGFLKSGLAGIFARLHVCAWDLSNFPPTAREVEVATAAAAAAAPLSSTSPPTAAAVQVFADGESLRSASSSSSAGAPLLHILIPGVGAAKNLAAQVLAACVLPDVLVHVVAQPDAAYLRRCPSRVVVHGELPPAAFAGLLQRMDLVSYVSVSECSPGVVLESLAAGVPCLMGHTSPIYDDDEALAELLTVDAPDDPAAISAAMARVVALLRHARTADTDNDAPGQSAAAMLSARLRALARWRAEEAAASWTSFFEATDAHAHCLPAPQGDDRSLDATAFADYLLGDLEENVDTATATVAQLDDVAAVARAADPPPRSALAAAALLSSAAAAPARQRELQATPSESFSPSFSFSSSASFSTSPAGSPSGTSSYTPSTSFSTTPSASTSFSTSPAASASVSASFTPSISFTPSPSTSPTPSASFSSSPSSSASRSSSFSPSASFSSTPSTSASGSASFSASASFSSSPSTAASQSASFSSSPTPSISRSGSYSASASFSTTPSPSISMSSSFSSSASFTGSPTTAYTPVVTSTTSGSPSLARSASISASTTGLPSASSAPAMPSATPAPPTIVVVIVAYSGISRVGSLGDLVRVVGVLSTGVATALSNTAPVAVAPDAAPVSSLTQILTATGEVIYTWIAPPASSRRLATAAGGSHRHRRNDAPTQGRRRRLQDASAITTTVYFSVAVIDAAAAAAVVADALSPAFSAALAAATAAAGINVSVISTSASSSASNAPAATPTWKIAAIGGGVAAFVALVAIAATVYCCCCRRKAPHDPSKPPVEWTVTEGKLPPSKPKSGPAVMDVQLATTPKKQPSPAVIDVQLATLPTKQTNPANEFCIDATGGAEGANAAAAAAAAAPRERISISPSSTTATVPHASI